MVPTQTAEALLQRFGDDVRDVVQFRGEVTALVSRDRIVEVCDYCKSSLGFPYLSDLTCVDWLDRDPRFDVVYHLLSLDDWNRFRLKVGTNDGEAVPSVASVWRAANWAEREVFDLFGVEFSGHPDLRRLLLPEGWTGFPLRKDEPQSLITLPRPKVDKTLK